MARPPLALARDSYPGPPPGKSSGQIPREPKTQPQAAWERGGFIPASAPQEAPTPRLPLTRVPAPLPGDRYLEDTHSQRCVLLQLAVLAGGLGGLPGQAVFVPPAAQVLMDRQTDRQTGNKMRKPKDPQLPHHPQLAHPSLPTVHTLNLHLLGIAWSGPGKGRGDLASVSRSPLSH